MPWIEPFELRGQHVLLQPLNLSHQDALIEAVQDGELWNLWYTFVPEPNRMKAEIELRLKMQEAGSLLAFAVINPNTKKVVGMTNYLGIDEPNRHIEIGGTWYSKSVQRTALNTECKLLLLTHAFEYLQCHAVEFRTHFLNQQSRRGIERLGAKLDGILRSNIVCRNGTVRDTCVYSIIAGEWPVVKTHLNYQLDKPRNVPQGE